MRVFNLFLKSAFFLGVSAAVFPLAAKTAAPAPPPPPSLYDQMLSHVEKVLVVDSIPVDRYEFFRRYRLAPSAGSILSGEEVASRLRGVTVPEGFVGEPFTGFTNEFGDYLIWAQEDTTGYLRLAESVRLVDGSWSAPAFTPTVLNFGEDPDEEDAPVEANAAFPFMLDDGQTLYFASDNAQSLGGYDIFIASRDPSDGSFLIPGNLGLPFNSEFDDYMMALDPQTGVGWWATDRNQLEGLITIYVYALSDDRVDVDPSDELLPAYASLSGWESLLSDEQQAERRRLLKEIASIRPVDVRVADFTLPMPEGTFYRYFSDFRNKKAASQMQLYLSQKESLSKRQAELGALRSRYAKGDKATETKIRQLEEQLRTEEQNLSKLLSTIYQLELSNISTN